MGKCYFPLIRDRPRFLRRAASAVLATGLTVITGCASYPGQSGPTAQSTAYDTATQAPTAPADPARAAAVAEIRAKAEAATRNEGGPFPNVFQSYGSSGASVMTRADRLAVEAELEAVLAAQTQVTDPTEAERLKARAAYLKRLAGQHGAQAEADIRAASQEMN